MSKLGTLFGIGSLDEDFIERLIDKADNLGIDLEIDFCYISLNCYNDIDANIIIYYIMYNIVDNYRNNLIKSINDFADCYSVEVDALVDVVENSEINNYINCINSHFELELSDIGFNLREEYINKYNSANYFEDFENLEDVLDLILENLTNGEIHNIKVSDLDEISSSIISLKKGYSDNFSDERGFEFLSERYDIIEDSLIIQKI